MDDHALDAIRYALIHIYKLGATTSLSEVYGNRQWRPERDPAMALGALTLDESPTGVSAGFGSFDGMEF
jgi:hypothetical protein